MATYKHTSELRGKTLKEGDIVILRPREEEKFTCTVSKISEKGRGWYLSNGYAGNNEEPLSAYGLGDPYAYIASFCPKDWKPFGLFPEVPSAKILTAVVIDLMSKSSGQCSATTETIAVLEYL